MIMITKNVDNQLIAAIMLFLNQAFSYYVCVSDHANRYERTHFEFIGDVKTGGFLSPDSADTETGLFMYISEIYIDLAIRKKEIDMSDNAKTALAVQKNQKVKVDTTSGSMAFNRLNMQISQTLHMAIEIFDNLDYLFVLDYYDDITLFDSEQNPESVSYYQMKTKDGNITINTAIKEDWLAKMYAQLENPDWMVKELGLITNCPLTVSVEKVDANGKKSKKTEKYDCERTPFSAFNSQTIEHIKNDIAKKNEIALEDVDLSKFFHIRTTLSLSKHREIVEQEMGEMLYKKYPKITIDSVKTIYSAMMELLTKKQQYETLSDTPTFEEVRSKKGVSKQDFERIIKEAMGMSIPEFDEIVRLLDVQKQEISLAYVSLITDFQTKSNAFMPVFRLVQNAVESSERNKGETYKLYVDCICDEIYEAQPDIELMYNRQYISVLAAVITINEMRRLL